MGRLSLLLVLAAAIGGSVLTLGTRLATLETTESQSEDQAGLLAREIAETGESLVLARMMGPDGFVNPAANGVTGAIDYADGEFEVDNVMLSPDGMEVTFTVTGTYGGARHAIQSTYEFDPMDAPGPIWLDVPYATATVKGGAKVSGSAADHPAYFDKRRYDALEVASLVPISGLRSALGGAIAGAGSALAIEGDPAVWADENDGLLEDLNIEDAEGLYQAAIGSMDASDRTFDGDRTESGTATWGTASRPDQITRVKGGLTVAGRVSGHGALVVEGALRVRPSGRLDWDGLVIVRSEENTLAVELDGRVDIDGMLVVSQEALPPGGHLDLTVYHAPTEAAPQGDRSRQRSPWRAVHPWHQHTHAFNITPSSAPRGNHVHFLEGGGAGRHGAEVRFREVLSALGSQEVYLEFGNASEHGFSRYNVGLAGVPDPIRGTVRSGFGPFASTGSSFQSKPFPANALRDLDVDIASLRALHQSFDEAGGITDWPRHIGWDWDRRGALALRLMKRGADGNPVRLYEASMYWHMRLDEVAKHEAEEAAWRARILAGEEFGTRLRMGENVDVTYQTGPIAELTDKMGFDGNEVVLISTAIDHDTPSETRAELMLAGDGGDRENGVVVCHEPRSRNPQTQTVPPAAVAGHLRHGDTTGPCVRSGRSGGGSGSSSGGSGSGSGGSGSDSGGS